MYSLLHAFLRLDSRGSAPDADERTSELAAVSAEAGYVNVV